MILIETGEIYYNTQVYFRKHVMDNLPNDNKVWKAEYHKWLNKQGAVIVNSSGDLIRNALGVAPGYDRFGFESDQDATLFVLRWS